MTTEVIVTSHANTVGHLSLNRPKALHALNEPMCQAMIDALLAWREEPAIRLVLLDHAADPNGDPKLSRGFCAGGDIKTLAASGATDGEAARSFFRTEYRLNHLLFVYPKPIVAFMDGITMGGGVGIAMPAKYRVATEKTGFAMPETGIGLFPDVGGGWYLSRLPGRVGEFLALTGARIDGAECMSLGLATHYIPSDVLPDVKAKLLAAPEEAEAILDAASVAPPPARIDGNREKIDRLFAADTVEAILAALEADGSDWAAKELATLRTKSPQACKVSLRLVIQGRDHLDFAEEMKVEYRLGGRIVQRHDFKEGVRAVVVEKDHAPKWDPATPEDVSDGLIDHLFAPLPDDEEWAPLKL